MNTNAIVLLHILEIIDGVVLIKEGTMLNEAYTLYRLYSIVFGYSLAFIETIMVSELCIRISSLDYKSRRFLAGLGFAPKHWQILVTREN